MENERHAAFRDPYMALGEEDSEDEEYNGEQAYHHTFSDGDLFGEEDEMFNNEEAQALHHQFQQEFEHKRNEVPVEVQQNHNEDGFQVYHENTTEEKAVEEENQMHSTPLFLATAANMYLDSTVTKFLQNDISVTKFLE